MNGTESLLLIIVGFLGIASSFYLAEDDVTKGADRLAFLFITAYGWVAFMAGNILFIIWLLKIFSPLTPY